MKLRPQDIVALERLSSGNSVATYWVAQSQIKLGGFWGECRKARNTLRYLERHGLAVGHGHRDRPPVRWWTITESGRNALEAAQ